MSNKRKTSGLEDFMSNLNKTLDTIEKNPEVREALSAKIVGNPITLGPRVPTKEDWYKDYKAGAIARADKWQRKTLEPKKDPQKEALAAVEKRKAKVEEALRLGKWEKAVAMIDMDLRQEIIKSVGATGYSAGVERKGMKMEKKLDKLQPLVAGLALEIDKMPEVTDAQREAKMVAARRGMIEVGKKLRGIT